MTNGFVRWMMPCRPVLLRLCWWLIASPVSWWLIGQPCSGYGPKGAFLVAVPDPQSANFPVMAHGFAPVPMVPFAFRSLVIASANDSFGSQAHAEHCAIAWGSTFVDIGQAGHINADSGHGEWNEGYALFQQLAG